MRISLLLLFVKILIIFPKNIIELNNESFNNLIEANKYNKTKKLLVVFYAKNCKNCDEAINILSNEIIKKHNYDGSTDFGKINCDLRENIWLNLRFNITLIPYIILIEGGNNFYELNSNYDKFELKHFINDEKDKKYSLEIPDDIDIGKKRIIIFKYTVKYIRQFFKTYFNVSVHKNIIIFILILLLILFIYTIIYIIEFCCIFLYRKCKKINVKNEKKEIIQLSKNEDLSGISDNLSGSELKSKEEDDNSMNISEINENLYNEEIDESEVKKIYKEKIE